MRESGTNEKGKQQPTPNMLGLYLLNWRLIRQMVFATNFRGISRKAASKPYGAAEAMHHASMSYVEDIAVCRTIFSVI
ncbi:hypothetical protein P8452_19247 [Trifolium repens]|nr:hypothetical protein P8452_19247 [Trifolium repens]